MYTTHTAHTTHTYRLIPNPDSCISDEEYIHAEHAWSTYHALYRAESVDYAFLLCVINRSNATTHEIYL